MTKAVNTTRLNEKRFLNEFSILQITKEEDNDKNFHDPDSISLRFDKTEDFPLKFKTVPKTRAKGPSNSNAKTTSTSTVRKRTSTDPSFSEEKHEELSQSLKKILTELQDQRETLNQIKSIVSRE